MAYDKDKDVLVETIGRWKTAEGKQQLTIGLWSYKGGDPKVAINRTMRKDNGEEVFLRLGRLSLKEARKLARKLTRYFKAQDKEA